MVCVCLYQTGTAISLVTSYHSIANGNNQMLGALFLCLSIDLALVHNQLVFVCTQVCFSCIQDWSSNTYGTLQYTF